jgi:hypothetical protein
LGFFSELIVGSLGIAFYFVLYLMLYFLSDQAEVDLWKRLKGEPNPYEMLNEEAKSGTKIFDINALITLVLVLIPVGIGTVVGFFIAPVSKGFQMPLEPIIIPMLIMGIIFMVGGVMLILFLEKSENEGIRFKQLDWKRYTLDNYSLLKNIVFGSSLFLNFIIQWNLWAFFMKFPMTMGPHSGYYIIMIIAAGLFFGGVQLLVKIFKEKGLKDNLEFSKDELGKRILIELLGVLLGMGILTVVSGVVFWTVVPASLFPGLIWGAVAIVLVFYLLTFIIKMICMERGVFGYTIFLPILLFNILAFFLHV